MADKGKGNTNLDFGGKAITVMLSEGTKYCVIDCENIPNSHGFLFHNGETNSSAVVGFTIRNANSIGDHPNVSGGGFSCFAISSPTIRNNIIINNVSRHGGGIFCDQSSSPKIIGNVIINNTALMDGGGDVVQVHPSPLIINNVISDNKAPIGGGVICGWRNSSLD